jgi:Flp pilus assembly protein TadD
MFGGGGYLGRCAILVCALLGVSSCSTGSGAGGTIKDPQTHLRQTDKGSALRLARAARSAGDFASAINLYRGLAAQKPEDPALLSELGDTLVEAGSLDDAIGVYGKVNAGSPARLDALIGLSGVYLRLNEPDKAFDYVNQAAAIAPGDVRVLIRRGVALDSLTRHADAQNCYRAALVTAPRSVTARNNLALSLALSGQFDEAIALMTPMARSSDASPKIRQNLAFIYGLKGDEANAEALSKIDLKEDKVEANLHFFDYARDQKRQ